MVGHGWFRLIDTLGTTYGRRYYLTGRRRQAPESRISFHIYEARDRNGNNLWLEGGFRCRYVEQQEEDAHSANCRILKRAHRAVINQPDRS